MKKGVLGLIVLMALLVPMAVFANGGAEDGDSELRSIDGIFDRILIEDNGQSEWAAAFRELTGVRLNVVKPVHNQYSEILGATFASGDLPDICEVQTNDYLTYAASGHLVALDEFIASSEELRAVDPALIEAYRLNSDGKIYGIPTYDGGGCVTYVRQDWLDNLGLEAPQTYDELVAVLRAFTFEDPDGNGRNDTIGMTLPFDTGMEFDYYNRLIMQDAMFAYQQLEDGTWVDGFTQPAMVEALQRFQNLYAEGLIDSEFFSNKTSTARSKIYEGQAGMMEYWSGTWAERFDASAKNANPAAEVVPMAPIAEAFYINRVGPAFCITTAADDPGAVFDVWINTMLDKGEGQVLFTMGLEGIHWANEGGEYVMLPEPANPDRPFDKAYSDPTLVMNGWEVPVPFEELISLSREIHRANAVQLQLPQGGDNYVKYNGELLTMKQEVFAKIVTGELSVSAGLAEYSNRASALAIDDIIAELNS